MKNSKELQKNPEEITSKTGQNILKGGALLVWALAVSQSGFAQKANKKTTDANKQTITVSTNDPHLVTKKQYEKILEQAKLSQEEIGEDMAKFIYGWGIEKRMQEEIKRQNTILKWENTSDEFSLFNKENINKLDNDKKEILSKEEMEKHLRHIVDSIVAEDVARYYEAFDTYQKTGQNIVGKKNGKGTYIHSGWNYAPFPTETNVDGLDKNKNIGYTNKEQEVLKMNFEAIYEVELSKWKAVAEINRQETSPKEYEMADLVALEKARIAISNQIWENQVQPIIDRLFKEYYSQSADAGAPTTTTKNSKKNSNQTQTGSAW